MRLVLPLILVYFSFIERVVGLPVANLMPSCFQKRRAGMAQLVRGGAVEKGDQKGMRRFSSGDSRMPSLFSAEEAEYNRFAACLAATEGLRRMRDQALLERPGSPDEERKIADQYQANSGRVLRAMGMSIDRFNELGRQISMNDKLKDKVMEQAYLYRMAAMVNLDQVPLPTEEGPDSGFQKDKIHLFCQSVRDIEKLRADQVERLKKSLHVVNFPASISISDPTLLPFLSPKVRAVVKAFPLQAEDVVRKNGLDSKEFNRMLQEVKSNPMFRWRVQKHLKQEAMGGEKEVEEMVRKR